MAEQGHRASPEGPILAPEFARWMMPLAPFEAAPVIVVATSGGADSLALTLLAAAWARRRAGRAIALTVDHGLRPGSAAEARRTGRWLAERGIEHHVLRWLGEKPARALQASAREARYHLLCRWCRRHHVLHLLLAHHLEDQAETLLMRLARGSGVDGLAAMAPSVERQGVRLLRPLLDVPRVRLRATLNAHNAAWIEDPSNENPAFLRARARRALVALAPVGIDARGLAATARRLDRARQAMAVEINRLLAGAARLHAAGYCHIDPKRLAAAPEECGLRVLARVLVSVSGAPYPPRLDGLERLYQAVRDNELGAGRTLAGCRVVRAGEELLVCREPRAAGGPVALVPDVWALWDRRFRVRLRSPVATKAGGARVAALGDDGWRRVRSDMGDRALPAIPRPVITTLPALWTVDGGLAVPHLTYQAPDLATGAGLCLDVEFRPAVPLGASEGRVVVARESLA